jgi:hypothetical protein
MNGVGRQGMNHSPKVWRWYHWGVAVFGWTFLVAVHALVIVGPWVLVWQQYRDLQNGVPVVAYYQTADPLVTDTRLDSEKKFLYRYTFEDPTTGAKKEYTTVGIGKDKDPGDELHIHFNPETGTAGPPMLWAIVFQRAPLLFWSVGGVLWKIGRAHV